VLWNSRGETFNFLSTGEKHLQETIDCILAKTKNKKNYLKSVCGLSINACFSAIKIKWLIDNDPAVQKSIDEKDLFFGNLDSWILWNLTGGAHFTDHTNASRTLLMNIKKLNWDPRLCNFFGIPIEILPEIKSSSELFGYIRAKDVGVLDGVPITSLIGEQNASLIGQLCLKPGQAECILDENISLLFNTGQEVVESDELLTTVAYKLGENEKAIYALEGFLGNGAASVNWLKNSIIRSEQQANFLDLSSPPISLPYSGINGNCYNSFNSFNSLHIPESDDLVFVPSLHGLCAPEWLFQAKG
jgi:glycerol kinase